jgi:hypothetical protein
MASLIAATMISLTTLGSIAVSEIGFRSDIKNDILRGISLEAKELQSMADIKEIKVNVQVLIRNQCLVLRVLNKDNALSMPAQCDPYTLTKHN